MVAFLIRRLLQAVPALLGVTLVVFLLLHASGDPSSFMLPPEASESDRQAFRHAYGLDQPLHTQYGLFLWKAVQGDLGRSIAYGAPAADVLLKRVPATLELALASTALALLLGIPSGILAAFRQNSPFDYLVMLGATLGQSIAGFWLGLMLIMVVSVQLGLLPASGRGTLAQLVLPAITLSTWLMALMARMTRSAMLEVLRRDYIRTAYAKGLQTRVVLARHALKNALIPIITLLGVSFSYQMGGAVIVETVFSWPGVGTLVFDSVLRRDYPVVLATVLFVGLVFVLINLLVDLCYSVIDPRIRLERSAAR
ncbi:MAG: ABC transporter permease [Chloroflexi bacterium]|nr:ABC transporter permease [Chloroflexota bacterium]